VERIQPALALAPNPPKGGTPNFRRHRTLVPVTHSESVGFNEAG